MYTLSSFKEAGNRFDVVVVGGGIVGVLCAWEILQRGHRVALIEKVRVGNGSTGTSGGLIRIYHESELTTQLALASFHDWENFDVRFGESCGFQQCGVLSLMHPDSFASVEHSLGKLKRRELPAPVELLDPSQVRKLIPGLLSSESRCAIFEPKAGFADPLRATQAVARSFEKAGGILYEGTEVFSVSRQERITLITSAGKIEAENVVVATGAWTGALGAKSDLSELLSIRPKSIQINKFSEGWAPFSQYCVIDYVTDLYGRPVGSGGSYVGYEDIEWDLDPDSSNARRWRPEEAEDCRAALSCLFSDMHREEPALVGGRRAFDGYTSSGNPIFGPLQVDPRIIAAVGWNGSGFKTAPAVARAVADTLLTPSKTKSEVFCL